MQFRCVSHTVHFIHDAWFTYLRKFLGGRSGPQVMNTLVVGQAPWHWHAPWSPSDCCMASSSSIDYAFTFAHPFRPPSSSSYFFPTCIIPALLSYSSYLRAPPFMPLPSRTSCGSSSILQRPYQAIRVCLHTPTPLSSHMIPPFVLPVAS